MARPDISMSREEIEAFLRAERRCVLATLDENGSPAGEVAEYELDGDALVVACGPRSLGNIRRDDRVCAIVERFPEYSAIRGVIVHARAEMLGDRVRLPVEDAVSFDFAKIPPRDPGGKSG